MTLKLTLELFAFALAILGLLGDNWRNKDEPKNFKNLKLAGRITLALIVLAAIGKTWKQLQDDRYAKQAAEISTKRIEEQSALIRQQSHDLEALRKTNDRLLKVVSVGNGYNAQVHGIVIFDEPQTDASVRKALENLFLKFVSIRLVARNEMGEFTGRVDYSARPEVHRYLTAGAAPLSATLSGQFSQVAAADRARAFYFEVRCPELKILNKERIQYAALEGDTAMAAHVEMFPDPWRDFRRLYRVKDILLDRVVIQELGEAIINGSLTEAGPAHSRNSR
ncbi:MAG: hypothetical protein WAT74_06335 [Flavobacteriales bacterium]